MRVFLGCLLVMCLLAGCVTDDANRESYFSMLTEPNYDKSAVTQEQFNKDEYECMIKSHSTTGIFNPGKRYRICMQEKGYHNLNYNVVDHPNLRPTEMSR